MTPLLVQAAGALIVAVALMHFAFPRRFDWHRELARLSLLNRQIFWVHTLFVVLVLALQGALLLAMPDALLGDTPLARAIWIGLLVFWGVRLYAQWFIYDPALWRGQRLETCMHCAFTAVWAFLTAVPGLALAGCG